MSGIILLGIIHVCSRYLVDEDIRKKTTECDAFMKHYLHNIRKFRRRKINFVFTIGLYYRKAKRLLSKLFIPF